MSDLVEMRARQLGLKESVEALMAKAEEEERDLTDEEEGQVEEFLNQAEKLKRRIDQQARLAEFDRHLASSGTGRRSVEASVPAPRSAPRDSGKWGFASLGHCALSVISAAHPGNQIDPRLTSNQATTFGSEGIGADSGFLIPPDFRSNILIKVTGEESLVSRADVWPTKSNQLILPVDETTPWQTSGGIQVYWEAEAAQITASKPNLQQRVYRLNRLTAFVPLTEDVMEDANALDAYLMKKIPEKMDFAITNSIVNGTGIGEPLGVLKSGALVTVDGEGSQTADTVNFQNVVKVWNRVYAPSRSKGIWLINQEVEAQLQTLAFPQPTDSTSSIPAYLPMNGLSGAPYATLYGRPVVVSQACPELGDKGDIGFYDFSQYLVAMKSGTANPRADTSIHFYFDQAINSLRVIFRLTGAPWWSAPISPRNGSNTLSAFVTLGERAGGS